MKPWKSPENPGIFFIEPWKMSELKNLNLPNASFLFLFQVTKILDLIFLHGIIIAIFTLTIKKLSKQVVVNVNVFIMGLRALEKL